MRRLLWAACTAASLCVIAYLGWVAVQIHHESTIDEAHPADVILVLGAAEYRGRPSPVFRARLDHGLDLYRKKYAPRILTTGGAGGDPIFTEGTVGRAYLIAQGVPSDAIIVEPEGESTAHSTVAAAEIMQRMNLGSCILVSDGYHIFRAKRMLEGKGVKVYGSPRPSIPKGDWKEWWVYARQSVGYLLWSVGIRI